MEGVVCGFSRSGKELAVSDGEVKIWGFASETLKQRLKLTAIMCLSWSRLTKVRLCMLVKSTESFHRSQEKERDRLLNSKVCACAFENTCVRAVHQRSIMFCSEMKFPVKNEE